MSGDTIKVETPSRERSDVEALRAAPVSLPAGSFDSETLGKALKDASLAKNDDKRDDIVAKAIDEAKADTTQYAAGDLAPGYKRVEVDNRDLGITETRVVFDPSKADEAEAAQANAQPVIQPGATDAPGQQGE